MKNRPRRVFEAVLGATMLPQGLQGCLQVPPGPQIHKKNVKKAMEKCVYMYRQTLAKLHLHTYICKQFSLKGLQLISAAD